MIFYFSSLLGKDSLSITSSFIQSNIVDFASYYRTSQLENSIDELIQLPDSLFLSLQGTGATFHSGTDCFWVKMRLYNPGVHRQELILQVRNVRINELQFFSLSKGKIDSSGVMGDYHPFDQRLVYHPFYLYPISLGAKETMEVYVQYKKIGETLSLYSELWDREAFLKTDKNESFWFSLFLGSLICIATMTSLIAFFSGRRLLISFALYCLSCLLMVLMVTGYGFMFLWPNVPYVNGLGYLFVIFYYLSMLEMSKIYLETKQYAPHFHRFFQLAQHILTWIFIPLVLSHWYLAPIVKTWTGQFGLTFVLTSTLAILVNAILIIRKKKTWGSLFFLLGFAFTIFAIIMFEIEQFRAKDTLWGIRSTLLFILLDFLILLVIFSNQIRQTFVKNFQLQQALAQSKLSAANALIEGQIEERKRLSRDLHDSLSIKMALLKMKLSQMLSKKNKQEGAILMEVTQISADIRALSHALTPLNLDQQSLTEAIEDLAINVEHSAGIEVQLDMDSFEENELVANEKQAIFQSLQELFNNAIKYANASHIQVRLKQKDQFELHFSDNGQGFDPSQISNGIGLKNIEARAQLLNGQFDIQSNRKGSQFAFVF